MIIYYSQAMIGDSVAGQAVVMLNEGLQEVQRDGMSQKVLVCWLRMIVLMCEPSRCQFTPFLMTAHILLLYLFI